MENLKTPSRSKLIVAAISASATLSLSAFAQEDERASALEEVLVVAQRVEESLQDTPIAVSVFSADTLEALGVYSANEIAHFTPNMTGESQPGSTSTTNYTIRGITTTDPTLSVEAGVGVYLNGIYVARSNGLIFDVVELESIEVLRGPQGTLYGRNTTGGAIRYHGSPEGRVGFQASSDDGQPGSLPQYHNNRYPGMGGASRKVFVYALRAGWLC